MFRLIYLPQLSRYQKNKHHIPFDRCLTFYTIDGNRYPRISQQKRGRRATREHDILPGPPTFHSIATRPTQINNVTKDVRAWMVLAQRLWWQSTLGLATFVITTHSFSAEPTTCGGQATRRRHWARPVPSPTFFANIDCIATNALDGRCTTGL